MRRVTFDRGKYKQAICCVAQRSGVRRGRGSHRTAIPADVLDVCVFTSRSPEIKYFIDQYSCGVLYPFVRPIPLLIWLYKVFHILANGQEIIRESFASLYLKPPQLYDNYNSPKESRIPYLYNVLQTIKFSKVCISLISDKNLYNFCFVKSLFLDNFVQQNRVFCDSKRHYINKRLTRFL